MARVTYIRFLERLGVDAFKIVPSFLGRHHLTVGKDRAVQRPLIGNDLGNKFANVAVICQSHSHTAVADDRHGLYEGSWVVFMRQTGNDRLIPPANVDDGVWNLECFDVVQESFFLRVLSVPRHMIFGFVGTFMNLPHP